MTFLQLVVIISSIVFSVQSFAEKPKLRVLNWSEYMDPALIQAFEQEYQVNVVEVNFNSDEERTELLLQNNGEGYDLILSSGIELENYVRRGWIEKLEPEKLDFLDDLYAQWRTAFPQTQDYAVPYFWGTVGILYRKDLIKVPITSWKQLYEPNSQLVGKIGMMEDSRDLVGMALKSLGYSANSEDWQQLNQAELLLHAQKPSVRSYEYPTLDKDAPIVQGDVWAAMMYSGDALMVKEFNENLKFVLPDEGGSIWVDYWTIAAKSQHSDLAYQFLNYINQPTHAAQLAEYVYYPSPNKSAEAYLSDDFLNDSTIYPTEQSLSKSEFFYALPDRAQRRRNNITINLYR